MAPSSLSRQLRDTTGVAGVSLAAVLREIARAQPPVVRRLLAPALGLSRATVSNAVTELLNIDLLTEGRPIAVGPGRPVIPLHWSETHACLGVSIRDRHGLPSDLLGAATSLGGMPIGEPVRQSLSKKAKTDENLLIQEVTAFIERLRGDCGDQCRTVLGVGIAVGGHVDHGVVRLSHNTGWGRNRRWSVLEGFPLEDLLQQSTGHRVVVENDITALAIHQNLYAQPKEKSYAVIAVMPDGIGAGLILDDKPWRGRHGMAGEIGHVKVSRGGINSDGDVKVSEGDDKCRCGRLGCVEAYATPDAIRHRTGNRRLGEAARRPRSDAAAWEAFRLGGHALGSGIAPLLNWLNLGSIVVYLPPSMEDAREDQAGHAYIEALWKAIKAQVFSNGADISIDFRGLPLEDVETQGVIAAASLVLERTIEDLETNADLGDAGKRPATRYSS